MGPLHRITELRKRLWANGYIRFFTWYILCLATTLSLEKVGGFRTMDSTPLFLARRTVEFAAFVAAFHFLKRRPQ